MNNQLLSISKVQNYLTENGWNISSFDDYLQKIKKEFDGEQVEMVIPKIENLKDYAWRIRDFVKVVSILTDREFNDVFEEILNFGYDLMSFHFESEKIKEGVIPLDYASDAMKKIVDIIKFESCSEINPKSKYIQPYKESRKLIENCELAQTEPGSFIINIRIPLDKTYLKKEEIEEEDHIKNLGRGTIKRLLDGIEESKTLPLDSNNFEISSYEKLNKNVCDAISKLLLSDTDNIKIEISTKLNSQEKYEETIRSLVKINSKDNFKIMNKISSLFNEVPEDKEATIIGKIIEMKRQEEDSENEKRLVKIYDNKLKRNIYSWLEDTNYKTSCNAHRDKKPIEISGVLTQKENGKWFLENISSLKVI